MTSPPALPDEEYQAFLDEPFPTGIDMYDPATGQRCRTRRDQFSALARPRHVALTDLRWKRHTLTVSTVHLIHDYRFGRTGPPVVYETMIFGATDKVPSERLLDYDLGDFQARYSYEVEARAGHELVVRAITGTLVSRQHTVVRHEKRDWLIEAVDPVVAVLPIDEEWRI